MIHTMNLGNSATLDKTAGQKVNPVILAQESRAIVVWKNGNG